MKIRTVLAPTDFSPSAAAAAKHANQLAKHFDASLIIVHVIEPEPAQYLTYGYDIGTRTDVSRLRRLEAQMNAFASEAVGGQAYESIFLNGDPAHRIEHLVRDQDIDLVVMATRGHGAFRRFLLGSISAKLLHDLSCPILTGAHLAEAPFHERGYRRIGCALGLRDIEHSEKALRWADDFARSWDAALHVIHTPAAIDWAGGEWFPPDTRALLTRAARENLDELLAKTGCSAELHLGGDDAAHFAAETIAKEKLDLLIVGRSVDHGLFGGHGSNAYPLIREAGCPVASI